MVHDNYYESDISDDSIGRNWNCDLIESCRQYPTVDLIARLIVLAPLRDNFATKPIPKCESSITVQDNHGVSWRRNRVYWFGMTDLKPAHDVIGFIVAIILTR